MVAIPPRPLGSAVKVAPAAAVYSVAGSDISGAALSKNAALRNPQEGTETLEPSQDRRPSASQEQKEAAWDCSLCRL